MTSREGNPDDYARVSRKPGNRFSRDVLDAVIAQATESNFGFGAHLIHGNQLCLLNTGGQRGTPTPAEPEPPTPVPSDDEARAMIAEVLDGNEDATYDEPYRVPRDTEKKLRAWVAAKGRSR